MSEYGLKNGELYELPPKTAEELRNEAKQEERKRRRANIWERDRQLTSRELLDILLADKIQTAARADKRLASRMVGHLPTWESLVGTTAEEGQVFAYDGMAWYVKMGGHVYQADWKPGTVNMYARAIGDYAGTMDDPIPYGGYMPIQRGKIYFAEDKFYRGLRDSGNEVFEPLAELAKPEKGAFVEEVKE